MTQAHVNQVRLMNTKYIQTKNSSPDLTYQLSENKIIRLYYSNVKKSNVVSFNISTGKFFIINRKIWDEMKQIFPQIDKHLNSSHQFKHE